MTPPIFRGALSIGIIRFGLGLRLPAQNPECPQKLSKNHFKHHFAAKGVLIAPGIRGYGGFHYLLEAARSIGVIRFGIGPSTPQKTSQKTSKFPQKFNLLRSD